VTTLVPADYNTFGNPNWFVIDSTGRLLWDGVYDGLSDSSYAVMTYSGGNMMKVCDISYFTWLCVDGLDRLLVYGYAPPRLYSTSGEQLSWPYGNLNPQLLGRGDFWRNDMYIVDDAGRLLEVGLDGSTTLMGTSFTGCAPLFFGDEGALYVAEPASNRILKITPELVSLSIQISAVELCWPARTNRLYQLQYRSGLTTDQWTDLGAPIAGNGGIRCATESTRGIPQRFYRVIELP
jgi:hypothetical protein